MIFLHIYKSSCYATFLGRQKQREISLATCAELKKTEIEKTDSIKYTGEKTFDSKSIGEKTFDNKRVGEKKEDEENLGAENKKNIIVPDCKNIAKKEYFLIGLLGCCFLLTPLGLLPVWVYSPFATALFYLIFVSIGFYLMVSVSQSILEICYNCFVVLLPLWVHALLAGYAYGRGVPGFLWGFEAYVAVPLLATKGKLFWSSFLLGVSCCLSMPYIEKPRMITTLYSLLWGSIMVNFFIPIALLQQFFADFYVALLFASAVVSLLCVVLLTLVGPFIGRFVRCAAIIGVCAGGYFGAWLIYKSLV